MELSCEELLKKQEFVHDLGELFKKGDIEDVVEMSYHYKESAYDDFNSTYTHCDEAVHILYKSGRKKIADVSCDSCRAIMFDVCARLFGWRKMYYGS